MNNQNILLIVLVAMILFAGVQSVQLMAISDNIQSGNFAKSVASSSGSSGSDIVAQATEIPEQIGGCFR